MSSTGAYASFHNLVARGKSTLDGYNVMANNQNPHVMKEREVVDMKMF